MSKRDIQTPAEKFIIKELATLAAEANGALKVLDVGAAKSVVIAEAVYRVGGLFTCDRIDIHDCAAVHPTVGKCVVASVEEMTLIASAEYDAVFANYVLEHVANVPAAAREIYRVLKPGGKLILSTPNPRAPEFILARYTPLGFHQFIKGTGEGSEAHPTHYAYHSINELVAIFKDAGFHPAQIQYYSFTYGYLYRFPVLNWLSIGYDYLLGKLSIKRLLGNVGIIFQRSFKN